MLNASVFVRLKYSPGRCFFFSSSLLLLSAAAFFLSVVTSSFFFSVLSFCPSVRLKCLSNYDGTQTTSDRVVHLFSELL